MALSPTGLIGRLRDAIRGDTAQDAFGGDELFDGETPRRLGPKIALIASGVLFLGLVGLAVAVYFAGKNAPPPPQKEMMPLAALQVEEDDGSASPPASSAAPPTGAKPATPPAATQTADVSATDRSAERRPWLNKAPDAAAAAPGGSPAKPAAASPPPAAPSAAAPSTPAAPPPAAPPVAMTPPPPAAKMPEVAKTPEMAPHTPPPVQTAAATPAEAPAAAPEPDGAMPSILGPAAPGAPDRFAESGDLSAGGRPRLAEPTSPPVDRKSLSAPPPRFDNLAEMKAKTTPPVAGKDAKVGKVAVVVQGLGLSDAATEAALSKLPPAVTLSFSPYAHDLRKWLKMAKERGHEVLVEVPMESKQFPANDPGPLGLMASLPSKENNERLENILKVAPGAIGIDDITGSKFREAEGPMGEVFAKLKTLNLIYVQGQPGVRIGSPGVPNTAADIIIDERPFRAAIDARFDFAERLAKFQGSAVTVMSAKPVSFERLALWLEQIDKKGIALTPVSQVLVR